MGFSPLNFVGTGTCLDGDRVQREHENEGYAWTAVRMRGIGADCLWDKRHQ